MSRGGETAGGRGEVSSSRGWGEADSTQGERIWSSLVRQKVEHELLLLIPILWCECTTVQCTMQRVQPDWGHHCGSKHNKRYDSTGLLSDK
jgi:hypothetical protein